MDDAIIDCDDCPVTVSVARRVKPGKEKEYENWLKGISGASALYPGHLGANILRPADTEKNEYVIIYRFDSYIHAQAWENSEDRRAWISRVEHLVDGAAVRKRVTGLEFWFDLPTVAAHKAPTRYKMAITLTVVVYILVLLLSTVLAPLIGSWPFWMKLMVVIPVQVILMTYIVMPKMTQLLKPWLYR